MSNDDNGLSSIEAVAADITRELLRNRGKCQALPAPPAVPRPAAPAAVRPPVPAPPAAVPPAGSAIDTATVAIESNVADADVSVDAKFAGNAPIASLALSSGSHTIAVSAAGYGTWQRELTVTAGSTTRVKATLQPK